MKDIDFDELDKAVNSLMANGDQPERSSKDDRAVVAATESASTTVAQNTPTESVSAEPVEQPLQTPAAVPVRQSPPAVKRSGRFMDMVSKPTDVKRVDTPTAPSREGLSITPRSTSFTGPPQESVTPEPVTPTPSADTMPDPIDTAQDTGSEIMTSDEPTPASSEAATFTPSESPFIVDAKVEKRPLNPGAQDESPMIDTAGITTGPDEASTVSDGSGTDMAAENESDEPPLTPQVPELSSDLVAIESDERVEVTQAIDTKDAASDLQEPSVPLGASSIAQQYATQPSSGDQSHAAIYDASQYPEPVSHPAKNKAGWLWVLWVVLLLGVGAGGAIVLYNLGIIP